MISLVLALVAPTLMPVDQPAPLWAGHPRAHRPAVAVFATDGGVRVRWAEGAREIAGRPVGLDAAVHPDGRVFVPLADAVLAVDPDAGLRRVPLPAPPVTAPVVVGDGVVLRLADGRVAQVGDTVRLDGPRLPPVPDRGEWPEGLLAVPLGDAVVFGEPGARLSVWWPEALPRTVPLDAPATARGVAGPGGVIYVLSRRGTLYALRGAEAQRLAETGPTDAGLVVWGDALLWGDRRGRVWRWSAAGLEGWLSLGHRIRGALLLGDVLDVGGLQLVVLTDEPSMVIAAADRTVWRLPLPARPAGTALLHQPDDRSPVTLSLPVGGARQAVAFGQLPSRSLTAWTGAVLDGRAVMDADCTLQAAALPLRPPAAPPAAEAPPLDDGLGRLPDGCAATGAPLGWGWLGLVCLFGIRRRR